MLEKPPPGTENDDDWKAAEKALAEARSLRGSQRIEALKRAGRLRYDAHKRRLENDRGLERAIVRKEIKAEKPSPDR